MKKTFKVIFSLLLALCLCSVIFSACDSPAGVGRIKGVVVDADGDPLEDATVVVVGNEEIVAETNERGAFTLRNVEMKDGIKLEVTLQGYEKQQITVNKKDFENEVATPTITLNVGKGTVSGYVFSASGDERLAGAKVTVDGKETTTDENGAYTVADVTMLRSQRITVSLDGYTETGKTITVRSYNSDLKAFVNIALSPVPITIKNYKNKNGGNIRMAIPKKVSTKASYDVNALKTEWNIDGAASQIAEGISLNAKDPWNDKKWESKDASVINSYMYIYTDITAANAKITINKGIVKYADIIRNKPKGDAWYQENILSYADIVENGEVDNSYLPYIKVLVLNKNGEEISSFDWTMVGEGGTNNVYTGVTFDMTSCIGQDRFIVVACNIGYRATVNAISFGA